MIEKRFWSMPESFVDSATTDVDWRMPESFVDSSTTDVDR
jgi:hypothetical protein